MKGELGTRKWQAMDEGKDREAAWRSRHCGMVLNQGQDQNWSQIGNSEESGNFQCPRGKLLSVHMSDLFQE